MRILLAALALAGIAGCAATPLRYVDAGGKMYPGSLDRVQGRVTADIAGREYRGDLRPVEWTRARATLNAPGAEPLYCNLQVEARQVRGQCTDLVGGEYKVEGR
jgi:hypothetical protein